MNSSRRNTNGFPSCKTTPYRPNNCSNNSRVFSWHWYVILPRIISNFDGFCRTARLQTNPDKVVCILGYLDLLANSSQERNPFVFVLIDGDGMIFTNEFLKKGHSGGKEAAAALYHALTAYIERETIDIPTTSRVLCRIYANVKGLGETLVRAGIIEETSVFEEFVRGFTNGRTLFDFVDVGPGKDRADDKIIGEFESCYSFPGSPHC